MKNILSHPPTIETSHLTLRPLTMADDKAVYAYASDPEVTKYVLFETHKSIEDSRDWLQTVMNSYENHESSVLSIDRKDGNMLIGTIGYLNWSDDHKRIEIGYALSREQWSNGYVTEATKALIDYFFAHSDLVRIEARCRKENIGSARVMEKAGMKFEGILRKSIFAKGAHHDMKMYSIIRDEWQQIK